MEKTWNSDQSLVIQRWARLLPLALMECSWGEVTIVGCFLLAHVRDGQLKDHKPHSFRACADRHHVYDWTVIEYKDIWAWELKNPIVYSTPKPYFHPRGAIVWIDLTKQRDGKSLVKREPEQRIRRVVTNNKKRPSTSVSLK